MGHESRGIGMHAKSLLEHLPARSDVRYLLYAFDTSDPVQQLGITMQAPYTLVQTPAVKKSIDSPRDFLQLARIIWHRFAPLRPQPPDHFVQFDFMLGLPNFAPTSTALYAYDLIPLLFTDEYLPTPHQAFAEAHGLTNKLKKTLRALYYHLRYTLHYRNFSRADTVLSISENTARSLEDILHIPTEKIVYTPLAPVFAANIATRPTRIVSENVPFVFYIGATDSRKRVEDLVIAFATLRKTHPDVRLVLAGKEFAFVEKIPNATIRKAVLDSPDREAIITLGYVSDAEKMWLYRHAIAFVYPTLYEGFGLPILEAMQQRCIAISYDNSSIPEVAGDAALLVPTGNVKALSKAMEQILDETSLGDKLRDRGLEQSAQFTWQRHVTELFQALLS